MPRKIERRIFLSAAPHSTMLTKCITHHIILNVDECVARMLVVQIPRDLATALVILGSTGMVLVLDKYLGIYRIPSHAYMRDDMERFRTFYYVT